MYVSFTGQYGLDLWYSQPNFLSCRKLRIFHKVEISNLVQKIIKHNILQQSTISVSSLLNDWVSYLFQKFNNNDFSYLVDLSRVKGVIQKVKALGECLKTITVWPNFVKLVDVIFRIRPWYLEHVVKLHVDRGLVLNGCCRRNRNKCPFSVLAV